VAVAVAPVSPEQQMVAVVVLADIGVLYPEKALAVAPPLSPKQTLFLGLTQ
jgi:hypothetical protein